MECLGGPYRLSLQNGRGNVQKQYTRLQARGHGDRSRWRTHHNAGCQPHWVYALDRHLSTVACPSLARRASINCNSAHNSLLRRWNHQYLAAHLFMGQQNPGLTSGLYTFKMETSPLLWKGGKGWDTGTAAG
jgi:hypothetical protein